MDGVARRVPELEAGVGAAGEVVVFERVVLAGVEVAGVPVAVRPVAAKGRLAHAGEDDTALAALLAPAELGVVEVVGEVAAFDGPAFGVVDAEGRFEAADFDVEELDVGDAGGGDADPFVVLRAAFVGAEDGGAFAVDGDVGGLDDDEAVLLRGVEIHVGRDLDLERKQEERNVHGAPSARAVPRKEWASGWGAGEFGTGCYAMITRAEQALRKRHAFFSTRGSSASRRPSPKRLKPSTAIEIARPDQTARDADCRQPW